MAVLPQPYFQSHKQRKGSSAFAGRVMSKHVHLYVAVCSLSCAHASQHCRHLASMPVANTDGACCVSYRNKEWTIIHLSLPPLLLKQYLQRPTPPTTSTLKMVGTCCLYCPWCLWCITFWLTIPGNMRCVFVTCILLYFILDCWRELSC